VSCRGTASFDGEGSLRRCRSGLEVSSDEDGGLRPGGRCRTKEREELWVGGVAVEDGVTGGRCDTDRGNTGDIGAAAMEVVQRVASAV
jgi:hypothetical protein